MKKWYFAINPRGFAGSYEQIAVAVRSARRNTELMPICLYNGDDPSHVEMLKRLGVETVIQHRSSFEDDLRLGYKDDFNKFSGHWLRVDIPLIEDTEELVLYTDTDVMFLAEPAVEQAPRLLSAAPEFDMDNWGYFNSGVMVMNVPALRRVHSEFVAAIKDRLHNNFRYPAHDQASFNQFFGKTYDRLDVAMNWKPYWGVNERARIVHFHGPKPFHVEKLVKNSPEAARFIPDYAKIWKKNVEAYEYYTMLYRSFI